MIRRYTSVWYRLIPVVLCFIIAATALAQSDSRPPITPDNADQVVEIARLAFGETGKLALSPDGSVLALASNEGIWLYDALDLLAPPRHMTGHVGEINDIVFSADGELLASGGDDGTVRVWKVSEARQIRLFEGHEDRVLSVAFHPDGRQLASGDREGVIWFWANVGDLPIISVNAHSYAAKSLAYSPDGETLMSVGGDGDIAFHDTESRLSLGNVTDFEGTVFEAAFNPTRSQFAVATNRGLSLVDMTTGELLTLDTVDVSVRTSVYSANGTLIATQGESKIVELWDTETGERVSSMAAEAGTSGTTWGPLSMALSPDGTRLYSSYSGSTLRVWDVPNETLLRYLYFYSQLFFGVIFSPDGRYLAAENVSRIHVWEMETLTEVARLQSERGESHMAFSYDGAWLATAGQVRGSATPEERDKINEIHIWDTRTWEMVTTLTGHTGEVTSLIFHPYDSRLLAAGTRVSDEETDHNIYLWNIATQELLQTMVGHTQDVEGVLFTPTAVELISTSGDGTVRIWNYLEGVEVTQVNVLEHGVPDGLAISPDFTVLAVAFGEGSGRIIDVSTADEVNSPPGFLSVTPSNITINPASSLLSFSGAGHELVLFDLQNRANLAELPGHTSRIYGLAFSPDGTLIATASSDGSVRLWAVAEGE